MSHIDEATGDEEVMEQTETDDQDGPTAVLKKVVPCTPSYTPQLSIPDQPRLGYIKPVRSQLMTVYQDKTQNQPVHLDLDSGADVSYVQLDELDGR